MLFIIYEVFNICNVLSSDNITEFIDKCNKYNKNHYGTN